MNDIYLLIGSRLNNGCRQSIPVLLDAGLIAITQLDRPGLIICPLLTDPGFIAAALLQQPNPVIDARLIELGAIALAQLRTIDPVLISHLGERQLIGPTLLQQTRLIQLPLLVRCSCCSLPSCHNSA